MLPDYYISESKKVSETLSYFGNFSDVLLSGETISTQLVSISVVTGVDTNPSNMLYEGITIHNGNSLEQRIRLGIPGCIYFILFTITTSLGNTYERGTELAILPDTQSGQPIFTPLYETSTLYPYIFSDNITAYAPSIGTGKLFGVVQVEDGITASIAVNTSVLTYQQYYYTTALDAITTSILIGTGTLLLQTYKSYSYYDAIQTGIAVLNGTLTAATPVTYTIPAEGITTAISLQTGTLS